VHEVGHGWYDKNRTCTAVLQILVQKIYKPIYSLALSND